VNMSDRPQNLDEAQRTSQGAVLTDRPPENLRAPELATDTSLGYAARRFVRGITLPRMLSIFDNARQYISEQIELAAEIEESDDHLAGTLELRRTAVLRLEPLITAGNPDQPASVKAAELAGNLVSTPWFHELCDWLLRAVLQQHTACELLYRVPAIGTQHAASGKLWIPTGVRTVEPGRWEFDEAGRPRFYRGLAGDTITPVAGRFVLHSHAAYAGQPGRHAKVVALAKLWFLGRLDLVGWGEMVDSWSSPFVHFNYARDMSEAAVQQVIDQFIRLASRKCAATPEGVAVTLHDVPDQSPHAGFQDFVRRAQSKLLLGQDTAQSALEGQKTGSTIQAQVRDDIRDADAKALAGSLNETFFGPWCRWNFGPQVAPPRFSLAAKQHRDVEATARVVAIAHGFGLPIAHQWVYRVLDIQAPAEDDELLGSYQFSAISSQQSAISSQQSAISSQPEGSQPEREPLSGMQITSALDVLAKVTEGMVSNIAAVQLLVALGFDAAAAQEMVASQRVTSKDASIDESTAEDAEGENGEKGERTTAARCCHGLAAGSILDPSYTRPKPATVLAPSTSACSAVKQPFAGYSEAVRTLAEQCSSLEEFRAALVGHGGPTLLGAAPELDEELQLRTFGAYCAGRLETADKLRRRRPAGGSALSHVPTFPLSHCHILAGMELEQLGPDVARQRFAEAIDHCAQRTDLLPKDEFEKLQGLNRARAWTVARVTDLGVMKDLYGAVGQAIEGGQSYRDFLDSLEAIMEQRGWGGLEPWHARLVYDQNVAMAYSSGRTMQARDSGAGYWRKLPSRAAAPRPEHARFDNQVFSFSQMGPPPWDFGCQCEWEPVFDDELADYPPSSTRPNVPGQAYQFDANDYFRPVELRRGDYPREFWPLIESLASSANALLQLRE